MCETKEKNQEKKEPKTIIGGPEFPSPAQFSHFIYYLKSALTDLGCNIDDLSVDVGDLSANIYECDLAEGIYIQNVIDKAKELSKKNTDQDIRIDTFCKGGMRGWIGFRMTEPGKTFDDLDVGNHFESNEKKYIKIEVIRSQSPWTTGTMWEHNSVNLYDGALVNFGGDAQVLYLKRNPNFDTGQ